MSNALPKISQWPFWFLGMLYLALVNVSVLAWTLPHFTFYDVRRLIEIALFAVNTLILLLAYDFRKLWLVSYGSLNRTTRLLITLVFALGIISALNAPLPKYALLEVFTYVELFLLGITIVTLVLRYQGNFSRAITGVVMLSCACYGLTALVVLGLFLYGSTTLPPDMNLYALLGSPTFMNPRFLMQFLLIALPLLALPFDLFKTHKLVLYPLYFLLGAYMWALAILNQSRTLPVACVVILIVLLFSFGFKIWRFLLLQLGMMLTGAVLFFLLYTLPFHLLPGHWLSTLVSDRLTLWHIALEQIKSHLFLGVGPLHYPFYAFGSEQYAAHPHDAFLNIACEWGIPAVILMLLVIIRGFFIWVNHAKPKVRGSRDMVSISLTAAVIAAFIDSLVDGMIVTPLAQVSLVLIFGWMAGLTREVALLDWIKRRWFTQVISVIALLLCVVFMVNGLSRTVKHLPAINNSFLTYCNSTGCQLSPNYFAQGFIQFYDAPPLPKHAINHPQAPSLS